MDTHTDPSKCPFLNHELHIKDCPAFEKGCPFKEHTCPFKNLTHEEAQAILCKCPNLQEYLQKCPAYNPNKPGCPFNHEGKMDISKCPLFKSHVAEATFEEKYGHACPYLNKMQKVEGCPAFDHGCPFKNRSCPFKNMNHQEAVQMMNKCPHLKDHLSKCPKYNPNKTEGCPFEHEGMMDVTKCPHFAHHFELHGVLPKVPYEGHEIPAAEAVAKSAAAAPALDELPPGHATVQSGDASKCPYFRMRQRMTDP